MSCHCDHDDKDHRCTCDHQEGGCTCKEDGKDHHCRCDDHDAEHHAADGSNGAGFAMGVALGAAMAAFLSSEKGKPARQKAKDKIGELSGKSPDELLKVVKDVAGNVLDDIKSAAETGKNEASKKSKAVLDEAKKRRQK